MQEKNIFTFFTYFRKLIIKHIKNFKNINQYSDSMFPIHHWTDSKIRCHFLSCIIALAYLRLVELKLEDAGIHMTAQRAMELMRNLHSCLCWNGEKEKALRLIEEPSPEQARILAAFGHEVVRGVLQKNQT